MSLARFLRFKTVNVNWFRPSICRTFHSAGKEDLLEFEAVFPEIVRDLTDDVRCEEFPQFSKWFTKVLEYNVPNGNKSKAMLVPGTYRALELERNLTPENIKLANIMGWCIELFQSFTIVHDDITDSVKTRRTVPSWHSVKDVGLFAVHDGILMENSMYIILGRYFSNHPMYVPCLDLFHEVCLKSAVAQTVERIATSEVKSSSFTIPANYYESICKYKSGYFAFLCPITLGMYLSTRFDMETHRQIKPVLVDLGYILQVQNDLRDCFDNVDLNGGIGNDIEIGRCTWLFVTALQRATDVQKDVLKAHFGKPDPNSALVVRDLYEELNLCEECESHVEEKLSQMRSDLHRISKGNPNKRFFEYLDTMLVRENWEEKNYWYT